MCHRDAAGDAGAASRALRVVDVAAGATEAALHGQADRVRTLEAALIAGVRELRGSVLNAGFSNLPSFFAPTQKLRDVANGIAV